MLPPFEDCLISTIFISGFFSSHKLISSSKSNTFKPFLFVFILPNSFVFTFYLLLIS